MHESGRGDCFLAADLPRGVSGMGNAAGSGSVPVARKEHSGAGGMGRSAVGVGVQWCRGV